MSVLFRVNGEEVAVEDEAASLLEVLRDQVGLKAAKDGCSPQGQCGCCTVWVDGAPRVACVTPAKRVAGRSVTTLEGLGADRRSAWSEAFFATGASQCGFCTPGIVMRLAAGRGSDPGEVKRALLAHLCRCTGWQTILEAASQVPSRTGDTRTGDTRTGDTRPRRRDPAHAAWRAAIEGGVAQKAGAEVSLGAGGFADDTAPPGCLVAVPNGEGGWAVSESLREARQAAGKVQGRRSSASLAYPLDVPPGDWDLRLRTTWVDPAYLETDASWCLPGGEPATPLGNAGAFGGKEASPAPRAARELADRYGRPVRVLLSREDVVRSGPKRPPVAAGVRRDGSGVLRVVSGAGAAASVSAVAPSLAVEEVEVPGPPVSGAIRAAGWAEAAVLGAACRSLDGGTSRAPVAEVSSPSGATARAAVTGGGVRVRVGCGEILDPVVLRSYCIGATHMALSWVRSEGLAVDSAGEPLDLTLRSLGVLAARDMPEVVVDLEDRGGAPVNGSDAVFAAVAAAAWAADGFVQDWPTCRRPR